MTIDICISLLMGSQNVMIMVFYCQTFNFRSLLVKYELGVCVTLCNCTQAKDCFVFENKPQPDFQLSDIYDMLIKWAFR